MAILDIGGRSLFGATRLRGYKGDSEPKGKPQVRDGATLGSSRREGEGGFLDFWLKPLIASNYDYQATERKTGISAGHTRRVVEVMSRMETEAEAICPAAEKKVMGDRVRVGIRSSAANRRIVTDTDIAAVVDAHVNRGMSLSQIAKDLRISMGRVDSIRIAATKAGKWPSGIHRNPITDADIQSVRKLHLAAGFDQAETARRMGVTVNRVQAICKAIRRGKAVVS